MSLKKLIAMLTEKKKIDRAKTKALAYYMLGGKDEEDESLPFDYDPFEGM